MPQFVSTPRYSPWRSLAFCFSIARKQIIENTCLDSFAITFKITIKLLTPMPSPFVLSFADILSTVFLLHFTVNLSLNIVYMCQYAMEFTSRCATSSITVWSALHAPACCCWESCAASAGTIVYIR